MKNLLRMIVLGIIVLVLTSGSWASTITSEIIFDYGKNKTRPTQYSQESLDAAEDNNWSLRSTGLGDEAYDPRFAQDVYLSDFNLSSFESFTIEIKQQGNRDIGGLLPREEWTMDNTLNGERLSFGDLSKSRTTPPWWKEPKSYWVTDTYTVSKDSLSDIFDAVIAEGKFHIHFSDWGWESNVIQIDYIKIVAEGSPVPIPGAVWLLGSGLVGLVGVRKRFRKS